MAGATHKRKLISFLEQQVFDPILKAPPSRYPESKRNELQSVKRKTRTEKQRYRRYKSAAQVRQEFQDDIHSSTAKKVNSSLKRLKLPRLADVKKDFFNLADELGVEPDGREARQHHRAHPPHPWHKKDPARKAKAWRKLRRQARSGDKPAQRTLEKAESKKSTKRSSFRTRRRASRNKG